MMPDPSLLEAFAATFDREPDAWASAGGRVNLIGEHTDYHEGFVLPAAIDLRTIALGAARNDGVVRIRSLDLGADAERALAELRPEDSDSWSEYILGPFWVLHEVGRAGTGADVLVKGNVPFGGGLSSSASVEVAVIGLALALAGEKDPDRMDVARLARRAENVYCDVPCGAMDQVASACGLEGNALFLDCRTLGIRPVRIPDAWVLVVADSGVKHSVGGEEYARRQAECAAGMAVARKAFPGVRTARDLTLRNLEDLWGRIDGTSWRRLRHVVTENARVVSACSAFERGDAEAVGSLLAASHASLAGDYEVSCRELDALVELANGLPGIVGARLTGAGFGGNTLIVVKRERAQAFCATLADAWQSRMGRRTNVIEVHAAGGLVTGLL
jgi:galactokinase